MKRLFIIFFFIITLQIAHCNDFYAGCLLFDKNAVLVKPNFEEGLFDLQTDDFFSLYNYEAYLKYIKLTKEYYYRHDLGGNGTNLIRTVIWVLKKLQNEKFQKPVNEIHLWIFTDGMDNSLSRSARFKAINELKIEIERAKNNIIPIFIHVVEVRPNNDYFSGLERPGYNELYALAGSGQIFELYQFKDQQSQANRLLNKIVAANGQYACFFMIDRSLSLKGTYDDIENVLITVGDKISKNGFVKIPTGKFIMGAEGFEADESPAHEVEIDSFFLGVTPVTEAQWYKLMGTAQEAERYKNSNKPKTNVSFYGSVLYCNRKSIVEKKKPAYDEKTFMRIPGANGYYLPSESQMQYAARAETTSVYYTPTITKEAYNLTGELTDVGQFAPNPWGIFDLIGSIRQWTDDFYDKYRIETNFTPPSTGSSKMCYGASFKDSKELYRVTYRFFHEPDFSDEFLGFRIAYSE